MAMRLARVLLAVALLLAVIPAVAPTRAAVIHHRIVIYAGPVREPYMPDVYSSQPDGAAGEDTRFSTSTPTTNYGTSNLNIGEDNSSASVRRMLIKFNLSSIPDNAIINSATLSLWQSADLSNNNRTLRVYRSLRAWVETQATWEIYSTGNSWETAGGFGANDAEQTDIGSRAFSSAEANGEKQWTLTASAIQEFTSGAVANNGFLLKADTESDDMYRFYSSDETVETTQRPKLVIDYTIPTDIPTATNTATATDTPTNTATATDTPGPTPTATNTATDTATPTATFTPSITTATPTPSGYVYILSSGKTFVIDPEITFGEIVQGGLLVALLLVFLVYVIYGVIERWA